METQSTWQDTLYTKTFNEEYEGLRRRVANSSSGIAEIADIKSTLNTLYDMDGADWLGRGEVQSIALSAVIAAYESFIADSHTQA
ncbi:MAG: hypothetical protein Ta2F_05330 [Termitinemataceae bacterium]|nr:MAG: hypothetical protein Ta2F_05330 [Termitinemataceae bacterium]